MENNNNNTGSNPGSNTEFNTDYPVKETGSAPAEQSGSEKKPERKKPKTALLVGLPVLAVAAAAALILIFNPFGWGEGEKDGDTRITLSQYSEIERGMSYSEVTELLGSEGVLRSETGDPDSASYLTVYRWEGLNEDSQAIVVFSGGMVASKTHLGLSDE
jgi:hypothetical protein